MSFQRLLLVAAVSLFIVSCSSDDTIKNDNKMSSTGNALREDVSQTRTEPGPLAGDELSVRILPENPDAATCLSVVIKGKPGSSSIRWLVNGVPVSEIVRGDFCGPFERNDVVSVFVGTDDLGASASTKIANGLPRVVNISSTPDEIFAGADISVLPVAEDADGDDVSFSYQWLVNGEEDPLLVESTLPGSAFSKGDTLQVLITPNDFYDDGPVYKSEVLTVPNAQPVIVSKPPETITSLDYRYQVEANDPDDSQFTYRLDEAPDGMEIDPASGLVRWSLKGVEAGTYAITIIVTDPEGAEGVQGYSLALDFPK